MHEFIHHFMEIDGTPMQRTSAQCMEYLQNKLGYSFETAREVLGLTIAKGYIHVTNTFPNKTYNQCPIDRKLDRLQ